MSAGHLQQRHGLARVPSVPDADDDVDDPSGAALYFADASGAAGAGVHKLDTLAAYHVGSAVTALRKARLAAGADEGLIYATVDGAIGALVPTKSRDDRDFFVMLEMHLRQDYPHFLTGRDHVAFRSAFMPVKHVVDGDLCDAFTDLPLATQKTIAADLDRTPAEVAKKIEDARHRLL
mmetsp:Transcript_25938/g.103710  ORF Transcript_25938/g.103710 Transcript_25938/m.103710 type:complete len:178 (-) Transcript_25938:209-742(-)